MEFRTKRGAEEAMRDAERRAMAAYRRWESAVTPGEQWTAAEAEAEARAEAARIRALVAGLPD